MDELKKEVLEKAERHALKLAKNTLQFEGMGLDFQVVFGTDNIGQEWVLRLPRRKDVIPKTKDEKKILDFVHSSQQTFQVPFWEVFSDDLIAYKKLKGVPAVTTNTESQEENWVFKKEDVPHPYIKSLGKALAVLHTLPKETAREAGVTVETAEESRESMNKRMHKVKESYEVNEKLWDRWQSWIMNDELWPTQTGLIHGDLFPGHTLVDSDYSVTGIIDWTEAKVTDVSNDFTAFYLLFGEEALEKLISAYKEAGGYTWPKMKDHIIELLSTQAITIAEFAESSGLEEYREMATKMLENN